MVIRCTEADVLYLSHEEPREAIGVDAGDGLIFRYDETTQRLIGVTIVGVTIGGVQARLTQGPAGR